MKPVRRTDSCHTPVRKRTPPRTSAPKPLKKARELRSASATARWRMTAGSRIGFGWPNERSTSPVPVSAVSAKAPRTARARPAPVGTLDEPCHQARHRHREEARSEQVRLAGRGVAHLVQQADAEDERHDAEGQVDQEHPAPARLDQQPADRGTECGGRAADGRPQADGRPLPLRPESREEQPERGGEHERAATRLQDPGGDEEAQRRGDGTQCGGRREDGQPEQECLLAPGPIGPAAGGHERGGEDDGVGAEHPRQRAEGLTVVGGRDAREGDVDDEQIERGQEHPRQDDQGGQRRPGGSRGARRALQSQFCHETYSKEESLVKQPISPKCAIFWADARTATIPASTARSRRRSRSWASAGRC